MRDRTLDHVGEVAVAGDDSRDEGGTGGEEHAGEVERRHEAAVACGRGDEIDRRESRVLAARHPEQEVVVHEHRHVRVQQRAVDQMVDADHRPAVPDQDDRLQPALPEDRVGKRYARGERARAAVRRVHRVWRQDLRVGEADADRCR